MVILSLTYDSQSVLCLDINYHVNVYITVLYCIITIMRLLVELEEMGGMERKCSCHWELET